MLMTPPRFLVKKTKRVPIHKKEEGTRFNSTLGFDTQPVCLSADQGNLNLSTQAWLSVNSLNRNHTKAQLHLLSGLSFGYQETDQNNLTKPGRPSYDSRHIWANQQGQIHWDNCRRLKGRSHLMVPMEWSGTGPLRGMQSLTAHTITHPAILIRSCISICLYTITVILLHIQNIPLSGMTVACLHHNHSSNQVGLKQKYGSWPKPEKISNLG